MYDSYEKHVPYRLEIVVGMAADAWRRWRDRREFAQFVQSWPEEADRVARDLNVDKADLVKLCGQGRAWRPILSGRLNALGIDSGQLRNADARVAQELARCCALCERKARCARDLKRDPDGDHWKTYCLNSETLQALSAGADTSPAAA